MELSSPSELHSQRYAHANPGKRAIYVAYHCPPYLTWFGGIVTDEAKESRDIGLQTQGVWQ